MPTWILTVTSRTGAKVNQITGEPSDGIAVYDQDDLDQRLAAAKTDPRQLDVTVRRIA